MTKFIKIIHPVTNQDNFGFIPEIESLGTDQAPICLFKGEHFGPRTPGGGRGFGEAHILAAHSADITKANCGSVAEYLAKFLTEGTPVCTEGGFAKRKRTLAMRRSGVIVVLEYREQREGDVWSVVTAYKRPSPLPAEELCKIQKRAPIPKAVCAEIEQEEMKKAAE